MSKRVSYKNLLKEAISEYDTSKTVEVKGPMLDPILKWDGQGELPIYKDAASILERYYYNENRDHGVKVSESENEDGTEKKTAAQKPATGAGTEQAGTSNAATIPASKDEKEKLIAKEQDDLEADIEEEELEEADDLADDYKDDAKDAAKDDAESFTEDIENAVIEKLIAEMEEEDADDDDKEELEEADVISYEKEGPKEEAPKEKKATKPDQDATGAGTAQAGTGIDDGQVPDRNDIADELVKAMKYEQEETEEEEEEEDLDIDKEIKEGLHGGHPKKRDEDGDYFEEAFELFKEAIEDDDDEDDDEDENEVEDDD